MATIHLGRLLGASGFARTVAIKRMHPHYAKDEEFSAMFADEARMAARILHPNVVAMLDVVLEGGELLLVMDYVHGEPLSRLVRASIREGREVTPGIAATVMAQALHGLHAAHTAKGPDGRSLDLVHRDVSPQNILVGQDGTTRITDFGIAKALGRSHTTRDGSVRGKLAYMAPEQLAGTVDARTDVFAAGVVLWELLSRERLFASDGEGQTVHNVMHREIPRLTGVPDALARSRSRARQTVQPPGRGSPSVRRVRYRGAEQPRRARSRALVRRGVRRRDDGVGQAGRPKPTRSVGSRAHGRVVSPPRRMPVTPRGSRAPIVWASVQGVEAKGERNKERSFDPARRMAGARRRGACVRGRAQRR
jgi:serine/threonine protein kinase